MKKTPIVFWKSFQLFHDKTLSHVLKEEHSRYEVFRLLLDAMLCAALVELHGKECKKKLQLGSGDPSRGHWVYEICLATFFFFLQEDKEQLCLQQYTV